MAITNTVFKNPYDQKAEVWTAQGAAIYIGQGNNDPIGTKQDGKNKPNPSDVLGAINGITVSFGRQVSTKYPLGINDKPLHIVGAPSGTIQLSTLIGPTTNLKQFLKKFGNVCEPFSIGISNLNRNDNLGCSIDVGVQKIKCYGCIGTSLSYQIQDAGQGMIMASGTFGIKFTQMTWQQADQKKTDQRLKADR